MTEPKDLIEVLKSVVITASVDPKNWNVGLQAEASIRAVLAELRRHGYSVCGTRVDGVVPLIAAIDRAILKAATSRADRGPAEDAAAIRRAVLAELDRQGWQCMPKVATGEMARAEGYEAAMQDAARIAEAWGAYSIAQILRQHGDRKDALAELGGGQ